MAYIKKEPIIEFITKGLNNPDKTKAYGYDAIEILTEIEYTPTADVVEVVRCKNCKKFIEYSDDYKFKVEGADGDCHIRLMHSTDNQFCAVKYDDFCSYEKRRTDNDSL